MSRLFPSSTLNSVLSICPSAATEALSPDLLRFETQGWIQILANCEKVGGRRVSSWFVIYLLSFSCQSVSTRSKLNTFPWSLARWSASRRSSSWLDLGSYSDSFGISLQVTCFIVITRQTVCWWISRLFIRFCVSLVIVRAANSV